MNNQDIDALFSKASHCWDEGRLKEAFELFSEAAKLGDKSSMENIGYFYDYGIYVEKDERKAMFWYKKAYHAGSSSAAGNIGVCYKQRKEYRRALWWWYKSAQKGDKFRLLDIAYFYLQGKVVRRNVPKALSLIREAYYSGHLTQHRDTIAKNILKKHNAF